MTTRPEEVKTFDPNQVRIPKGKPGGGRWLKGIVSSAFKLDPDSAHEGTQAQRLWGASLEEAFPNGGLTRPTPWPYMARRRDVMDFDPEVVHRALSDPPELEQVDPRGLHCSQPKITRSGVDYYLNSPAYAQFGKTYQGDDNAGNRHPFVYVREDGQRILLSGHHRAAAALLSAKPLRAYVVHGPWGPPRRKS